MDISGINLQVERFGNSCQYTGIKIKKGEKEVYELSRNDEERTELFFGNPVRKYNGNQDCFIEYLAGAVAKETGENFKAKLDPKFEKQYQEFFQKILKL
ncbi:hypothetical protein D4Q76_03125 [archaeon]|nr:MAG: hypothetical protein D4Q76_03125 [archaeon]